MERDPLTAALANMLGPIVEAAVTAAMEHTHHDRAPLPDLLTAVQLCNQLQISRTTLVRLQHDGLPRMLIGDAPRYRLIEVLAWLQSQHASKE